MGGRIPKRRRSAKTVLVLRTCAADGTSCNDFRWPKRGKVEAPDWKPAAACGNGLHGLLWGEGSGSLLDWSEAARWLVVRVAADEVIDLGGKVKFPRGTVVHCGDRASATDYIIAHGATGAVVGAAATAGDYGTATAGGYGTATAGYGGTATAGYGGTATAGYRGTISIRWYDGTRHRLAVGYVGEGIEPGVAYRADDDGRLVRADARKGAGDDE